MSFTKLDYCQYLLSSQVNYTLTNLAEHLKSFSHDTINRYLKGEKLTPRLLFEQVEPMLSRTVRHRRRARYTPIRMMAPPTIFSMLRTSPKKMRPEATPVMVIRY